MAKYKIIVAYDGTKYNGWQVQPDAPTIANTLQDTFFLVFKKQIKISGASRTDTGVHALGQVAVFETDLDLEPKKILTAWSNILPLDIMIRDIEIAKPEFNPRTNVCIKTYYYHIFETRPLPFFANFGYWHKNKFDPKKLEQALQVFVGTHDFRSFCTGYEAADTVKTIDSIKLTYYKKFNIWRIEFKAHSFLRYMIRRIVGACLDIATNPNRSKQELAIALDRKDPEQLFFTAPGHGLLLFRIEYGSKKS